MKSPSRAPVKNLPARAELARRVDEMQTQLGRVANAVVEKKYDGVEDYEEGLEVQPGLPAGYQKTVVNAQEASRILKGKKGRIRTCTPVAMVDERCRRGPSPFTCLRSAGVFLCWRLGFSISKRRLSRRAVLTAPSWVLPGG